jgi:hypothetical protein
MTPPGSGVQSYANDLAGLASRYISTRVLCNSDCSVILVRVLRYAVSALHVVAVWTTCLSDRAAEAACP